MWVETFKRILAFFLTGITIKLLDNEVDRDHECKYKFNFINELNQYRFTYGLILLALAMLFNNLYAFSLFSSAYMIGMFNFITRKLPFKMKAYQEIIILILINLIFIPYKVFIHSLFMIGWIQICDDILDMKHDMTYGYFNFANRFGKGEATITSLILMTASMMLSPINTILIIPIWICINYLYLEA